MKDSTVSKSSSEIINAVKAPDTAVIAVSMSPEMVVSPISKVKSHLELKSESSSNKTKGTPHMFDELDVEDRESPEKTPVG